MDGASGQADAALEEVGADGGSSEGGQMGRYSLDSDAERDNLETEETMPARDEEGSG